MTPLTQNPPPASPLPALAAPIPARIALSSFTRANDPRPRRWEGTWQEWADELCQHGHRIEQSDTEEQKASCPMFSPATFAQRRALTDIEGLSLLVLDYDHCTPEDVGAAVLAAQAHGWAGLVYSAWKHTPENTSVRLVAPLARQVGREEWPALWARLVALLGGRADPQCKDASRAYFLPSTAQARSSYTTIGQWPGLAINVDAVLRTHMPATQLVTALGPGTDRVSPAELGLVLTKWRKTKPALAIALALVLAGEPFAEQGHRDDTMFKLAGGLAEAFPTAAPAHLSAHFDRSVSHWTDLDLAWVEDKIARQMVERATVRTIAEQAALEQARAAILEATSGARDTPYTQAEVDAEGEKGLQQRWIVQKGKGYWFYVLGKGYVGPFIDAEATRAAHTYLSPTTGVGVRLTEITDLGRYRPKLISELTMDYGVVAVTVINDLAAQKTKWENATATLRLAPCPKRPLTAAFHAGVDNWLRELAGVHYPRLEQWIAYLGHLTHPCMALFLEGPPGAGKSMLANGLARLWSTYGASNMAEAFASFNAGMARCPLVFADETMPREIRGRTAELRELIQARTRPYHQKFMPTGVLEGCLRVMIAANNRSVLEGEESLTGQDVAAIAGRLLYIRVPYNEGWWGTYFEHNSPSGWEDQDAIARHALYLASLHPLPFRPPRFLINAPSDELARTIATSTSTGSACAHWLVSYLLQPDRLTSGRGPMDSAWLMRVEDGQVLASVRTMSEHWGVYPTNIPTSVATVRTLSKGLGAISSGKRRPRGKSGSVLDVTRPELFVIRTEHLITWAEATGVATGEEIRAALNSPPAQPRVN